MEATGKYDFKASADDELSFNRGESLKILQTTGNWYKAEINGVEGFVPKNFIIIKLPSWYQENTDRSDSEKQLMSQPVGAFLIRGRKSAAPGNFSLSVRHATDVQHFKVLRDKTGQYSVWSETFSSLNQLVDHYKNKSISKASEVFLLETQQQQQEGTDSSPPLPTTRISNQRPIPTPRQHKPPSTLQVQALYSFHAEEGDELEFEAGDIIKVLDCSDPVWWKGHLRGKIGLFPTNYTKPI